MTTPASFPVCYLSPDNADAQFCKRPLGSLELWVMGQIIAASEIPVEIVASGHEGGTALHDTGDLSDSQIDLWDATMDQAWNAVGRFQKVTPDRSAAFDYLDKSLYRVWCSSAAKATYAAGETWGAWLAHRWSEMSPIDQAVFVFLGLADRDGKATTAAITIGNKLNS